MSDALSFLVKARPEAMGAYFTFLKDAGTRLDPKTRNLISVITKVHAQTDRGFRQYLSRALREGCTPVEILAQSRPYEAVIMQFVRARDGKIALVISQARSADFEPEVAVRLRTVREIVPVDLDGREARLEAGSCLDGSACSRIRWQEGEVHIVLTMQAPPVEIIRIARSMRR